MQRHRGNRNKKHKIRIANRRWNIRPQQSLRPPSILHDIQERSISVIIYFRRIQTHSQNIYDHAFHKLLWACSHETIYQKCLSETCGNQRGLFHFQEEGNG